MSDADAAARLPRGIPADRHVDSDARLPEDSYASPHAHARVVYREAVGLSPAEHGSFLDGVGAIVCGATTYSRVVGELDALAHPRRWTEHVGSRPVFVFATRQLPRPSDADIRFISGDVRTHLDELLASTGGRDLWIMGGADVASQFYEAGALDDVVVAVSPTSLASENPLVSHVMDPRHLSLLSVDRVGDSVALRYRVATIS